MAEVYILMGPEEGEKNNLIRNIRKKTLSAFPDTECYSFFVGDDDGASYVSAVSQSSLFSQHRFIVLRGFENIKKTDPVYTETLQAVKSQQDDLTLIIVSTDSQTQSLDKALTAAAGKERTIVFWELKDTEKRSWIVSRAREEGFRITADAVEEILSSVENNTEEMKNLLLSITNFLRIEGKEKTISRETVEAYSTESRGDNGYTLFASLAERDLDRALRVVRSIILNDQRDILPAVTVAGNQFRRIEEALKMRKRGMDMSGIFQNLTAFTTYSSAVRRQGVNFRERDIFQKAMKNYTLDETARIILLLTRMDTTLKSASSDTLLLEAEKLVYTITVSGGAECRLSLEPETLKNNPFA